jgi:hypothetical protein
MNHRLNPLRDPGKVLKSSVGMASGSGKSLLVNAFDNYVPACCHERPGVEWY